MSQYRPSLAPLFAVLGLGAAASLFLIANCSREDLYGDATFTDNVEAAYADCDANEISFLASKHGIQTAFENCGSNKFSSFAWSPDGQLLYFELTHGGYVMDGDSKQLTTVPVETPIGAAGWLRRDVLAVPIGPSAEKADGPQRIAIFNRAASTLELFEIPVRDPQDLQSFGLGDQVLFTAVGEEGQRAPYVLDPPTREVKRVMPWLDHEVRSLSYSPTAGLVGWSDGYSGELVRVDDGSSVEIYPGVLRVIPHSEGRYVALETEGAAISPFDQRSWNELSAEARERELARRDGWMQRLPEWAPREEEPPEIQVVDLETHARVRFTSFYGFRFQWYEAQPYYCSFILWGIEGKQLHRNIALVDLAERLRMVAKGETPLGVERVASPDGALPPDAPAAIVVPGGG